MSFRVVVDFDKCESNALCMGVAPEVFEVRDDDFLYVLQEEPPDELRAKCEEAARVCPKQAITIARRVSDASARGAGRARHGRRERHRARHREAVRGRRRARHDRGPHRGSASPRPSREIAAGAAPGVTVQYVVADVTDEADVERAVAAASAPTGRLDVLFACAGGSLHGGPIVASDADGWRATVDLNLVGTFLCIKHAATGDDRGPAAARSSACRRSRATRRTGS